MAARLPDSEDEMDIEESVVGCIAELNNKLEQLQQDIEIMLSPSTRWLKQVHNFNCFDLIENQLWTRMLLFGSKVTRAKNSEQPEVLLVVQGQTCSSLHQILNQIESEFTPDLNLKLVYLNPRDSSQFYSRFFSFTQY